ncbi:hypothetical protein PMAYCL1PPCAC_28706, partial [Pristionchus mayeri]
MSFDLIGGNERLGELLDLLDETRLGSLELGFDGVRSPSKDVLDLFNELLSGSIRSLLVGAHHLVEESLSFGREVGDDGLGLRDHLLLLLE